MSRQFKCALITGISGSGASYLAEYIVENHPECDVHGMARWHSTSTQNNLKAISSKVSVHECDLLDLSSVVETLNRVKPDVIFHMASHANVRAGFITPLSVLNNNIMGTANLFEGIKMVGLDPVVQLCSTAEVYGQVTQEDLPISETCPLRPSSPYAVSKTTQDHLGFTYWRCYGMKVIRTRMFAYLNPRRHDLFATSFARQVAQIELGLRDELTHGNLDSVRTVIDIRDAMQSYWIASEKCEYGEAYNISGLNSISVGQFLDMLKDLAKTEIKSRPDPALFRPADVTLQVPDVRKFESATGWKPTYTFEESIQFLLEQIRRDVARENGLA
jgi:GDPmannose 4,6-dehydratase/GDP-4-dehydro-6-deoxy-D-mannose reductase